MTSIAQLLGSGDGPVATVVNRFSSGGGSTSSLSSAASLCRTYASGALTANTLANVVNLTGRGRLNFACVYTADSAARTVRIKVVVDGATIFDATSNSISAVGTGIIAVGGEVGSVYVMQGIVYQTSLLVQIASSLTETDKIIAGLNYETWR